MDYRPAELGCAFNSKLKPGLDISNAYFPPFCAHSVPLKHEESDRVKTGLIGLFVTRHHDPQLNNKNYNKFACVCIIAVCVLLFILRNCQDVVSECGVSIPPSNLNKLVDRHVAYTASCS